MAARVIVALTLADAALIRPVCRTHGCTWTGRAWRTRWLADLERSAHRLDHLTPKDPR